MKEKIKKLLDRLFDLEKQLGDTEVMADQEKYRKLTQEHAYLRELQDIWQYFQKLEKEIPENKQLLLSETDPQLIKVIEEEIKTLENEKNLTKTKLEMILVPPDPRDNRNIILEIRAGTGGSEAALFVSDLVRMYQAYANKKKWCFEVLSTSSSDLGGFKEYIMGVSGNNVFRLLQYEGGTHRVQRVPETETGGRLHTSAATVAVLLEPCEEEKVVIDEKELIVDTYRSSGAGGQHVNVTDSAVRLTHKPTGIVVACQDERSQHKNKDKAMRLLKAKILEDQRRKEQKERSEQRLSQVGSGDRSERIRTYNFPQNRITDHRINLTLHKLDQIIDGDLDEITQALVSYFYNLKLTT